MSLKKYFKPSAENATDDDQVVDVEQKPYDDEVRQQFRALDVSGYKNKNVFLQANAGSGKTYEIYEFLKQHKECTTCVISFTRSVVKDIESKLPDEVTVDVMTFDSLASRNRNALLPYAPGGDTYCSLYYATSVLKKIKDLRYLNLEDYTTELLLMEKNDLQLELKEIFEYCMKHKINNCYLNKLLMLHKYAFKEYDVIFIDEAQDLEPLKRKILQSIVSVKAKIYVGDTKQSLYCDTNVFETIHPKNDIVFQLTHTFRYGNGLVNLLNRMGSEEHTCYPEKKTEIVNNSFEAYRQQFDVDVILISSWKRILKYMKYIESSVVEIDKKATKDLQKSINNHKEWSKLHQQFVDSNFQDEKRFFESKKKQHLLEFTSEKWEEFEVLFHNIRANRKKDKDKRIVITTVHRAKGLQYDNVYLDKSCHPDFNTNPCTEKLKENIYYTALTRCKHSLSGEVFNAFHFGSYKQKDMQKKRERYERMDNPWQRRKRLKRRRYFK